VNVGLRDPLPFGSPSGDRGLQPGATAESPLAERLRVVDHRLQAGAVVVDGAAISQVPGQPVDVCIENTRDAPDMAE
jgi:2-keto-4-pentenoate hydratase